MIIKKVGVLYHPMVKTTRDKAQELAHYLNSRSIEAWICSSWERESALAQIDKTDLILTAGGDGTILRAAQIAYQSQTPITGVNMGTLGFMTELKAEEALSHLPELLAGNGWIDERTMLEAELIPPSTGISRQTEPEDRGLQTVFYALNDVVLARGAIARLIQVTTCIDGTPLTTYRADGVILATATGSTGYSLAAGGPIVYPQSQDWLLVPILCHLGLDYSLLLSPINRIRLQLEATNPATLSIDGHINLTVSDGSIINVKQSEKKTRFLRIHPKDSFYNSLEAKLKRKK